VAVIAASSITNNSPANAASGSASANAPAGGDVFAAMLDQPGSSMAVACADAASGTDADATKLDDAPATPSADPNASIADPMLAQLLAAQQVAANAPAPAADTADTPVAKSGDVQNSSTDASATRPVDPPPADANALANQAATPADPSTQTKAAPRSGQQADDRVSGKDHHHARTDATHAGDPSQDDPALGAGDNASSTAADASAQAATPAIPSASTDAAAADAATAEAAIAALPVTNQAASGIVPNGTTAKPGKPSAGAASSDSSKSEDRNSKASALADAGDVAKRGFASEPAVRATALAVQNNADDSDKPAPNGTQPQHNAANPAAIAAPAQPDATPVHQATAQAAPIHTSQPQPEPGLSIATINTGASPTQTPAAPPHLAAQIQISPAAPDVNALAVNIAARTQDGQKHFDIRLDPAELGRVDVRLTVDDTGKAQAMLTVEKPQTLELLQKDQSHLERALKDAGLDLTQNGLSFSLKGQQQQQQPAQDHTPFARGQRLAAHAVAAIDDVTPILSTNGIAGSDTRLDIRV